MLKYPHELETGDVFMWNGRTRLVTGNPIPDAMFVRIPTEDRGVAWANKDKMYLVTNRGVSQCT